MENKILGVIIASFVLVVIGIALLSSLANQNSLQQSTITTTQLFTISNTTCTALSTGNCVASITSVTNGTIIIPTGNYTKCASAGDANYNGVLFAPGEFPTNATSGGSINVTYEKSVGCQYVADSTSRTLVNLNILFFTLAIVGGVLFWLYKSGIFGMF